MKTVSNAFLKAQASPTARRVREVFYKRRYWSAIDQKYLWEDAWKNVAAADPVIGSSTVVDALFELTDGSQEYTSDTDVVFNIFDEFGVDGYFNAGENYSGGGNTTYYQITLVSQNLGRTYTIRIHDDQIRNVTSGTSCALDATAVHAYRLKITDALTLDLYVDGVFKKNLGAGSVGGVGDSITYAALPGQAGAVSYDAASAIFPQDQADPWDRTIGGQTIDDESLSGGLLHLGLSSPTGPDDSLAWQHDMAAPGVGDEFSFEGRILTGNDHNTPSTNCIYFQYYGATQSFFIQLFTDGIFGTISSEYFAMDCTVSHVYRCVVQSDTTVDVYVDGVFAVSIDGDASPTASSMVFSFTGALTAEVSNWEFIPAVEDTGVIRIWFERFLTPDPGTDTVTPSARAESKIVSVSPISWQLDTDQLTEFKVSNLSIIAENFENEWDPESPTGHFAPDDTHTDGFEPYWTKFQIRSGFQLADGTKEYVNLFTGLAVEFRRDSRSRNVQIDIQGQEAFMLNSSAENLATHVVAEAIGTGDGTTRVFTTDFNGVGGIDEIRVAGVVQVEGDDPADYQLDNLNEALLPAQITFTNAPDIGEAIVADYFYWPQNTEFNDLVETLVDEWLNSDPVNSIDIQPFVVANNVINSEEFTAKADWDGGTIDKLDSATFPGSLVLDWENAAFRQAVTWSQSTSGWTQYGQTKYTQPDLDGDFHDVLTSDGTSLKFSLPASSTVEGFRIMQIDRATPGLTGSWSFKARLNTAVYSQLNVKLFGAVGSTGYSDWTISNGVTTPKFFGVTYAQTDSSEHTYLVTRTASGVLRLYIDGVLTVTSSYTGNENFALGFEAIVGRDIGSGTTISIKEINIPVTTAVGTWISPTIDWTTTPFANGPFIRKIDLDRNGELSGGTITFETDASSDNFVTHDGYLSVGSTDATSNSTPRRYVKIRATISAATSETAEPVINAVTIEAFSSSIPVVLPKLSGKNVYEAIQALAGFANYEFGIDSDQVFFFRPKSTVGDPVFELSEDDFIQEINDFQNGYERVYSKVEITYGNIVKRIEAADDEEDSPATRYLKKTFEFSADSDIQIAPTADIATAMSRDYFNRLSVRRRRWKATTKFLGQLEVADLCRWNFAFDKSGDTRALMNSIPGKIIGARYDTDRYQIEFDVEEVPT